MNYLRFFAVVSLSVFAPLYYAIAARPTDAQIIERVNANHAYADPN